jgi:hypothetical protein
MNNFMKFHDFFFQKVKVQYCAKCHRLSNIITKETGQNPKSGCHLFNIKRGIGGLKWGDGGGEGLENDAVSLSQILFYVLTVK